MTQDEFREILKAQINRSCEILDGKREEYAATVDCLHNFRTSASLQGISMEEVLAGYMAKHTISVYDMIRADESYHEDIWDEKITDHINYLFLLKAIIAEEQNTVPTPSENNYTPS